MENSIILTQNIFDELRKHLLQNNNEQLATILCGISLTDNQTRLLAREIVKAKPEDLDTKDSMVFLKSDPSKAFPYCHKIQLDFILFKDVVNKQATCSGKVDMLMSTRNPGSRRSE